LADGTIMSFDRGALLSSNPSDDTESAFVPAVLIVDDHPANLLALEAVLERQKVRIVRAGSGEQALAKSADQEFAVVLMDWRMPNMDGIEAARRMRERHPVRQTPVIILTAHLPDLSEIKTAYAAGVVDFLQKPYAPEVLAAKVSVFVQLQVQREQLRRYEQALRKRFQQDLVGVVSHDLRSPLNAISLAAETLLQRSELAESSRRPLRIIQSAAGRAGRLVRDLLDYTQVLHGTAPPLERRRFCLLELTREIVEELKASFPSAQVVIEREGSVEGLWDRDRLAQVITNLVSNAATYGAMAPIHVRLLANEVGVTLEVRNEGEPIPEESIPALFEPMKRGKTIRVNGNVGLRLFIVSEIVRAHGGTVSVSSTAAGTIFCVSLPTAVEDSRIRLRSVPLSLPSEAPPAKALPDIQ
jgi:signal transduction histidine kinase